MAEEARLQKIKKEVDKRLENTPEGRLRITSTGKHTQYMLCEAIDVKCPKQGRYLKKEEMDLARTLAQKAYDKKIQKLVDRRLSQIRSLGKSCSDNEIELIYTQMNEKRKELVEPVEASWEQLVDQWKSIPYTGKQFDNDVPEIYTKKGERVRSKSEKILADALADAGIEYKYECPLNLKGYGTVYPDFTMLSPTTRKEIYWEHDGRMDDPGYAEKAVRKINSYIRNQIIPGKNLIITFETSATVLTDDTIHKMIENFLV